MRVRSLCIQHLFFVEEDSNEVLSRRKHRKKLIERNSVLMQDKIWKSVTYYLWWYHRILASLCMYNSSLRTVNRC